jgi:hypothetical protein
MGVMTTLFANVGRLDRIALGLSGLCLVHCMATAVLLAVLASAGGLLGSAIIHEIGLWLAMTLGAIALGRGFSHHGRLLPAAAGSLGLGAMAGALLLLPHGGTEIMVTMLGLGLLALGHWLNLIASR